MQSKCRARACKLLQLSTMSSTEALSAGPSSSDVAIAELLRGMCQMQEELRVVRQVQEETTQQLSLQAHKDNFLFKKRGNECQFNIQVVDRLAVVSSCLDRVEAANAGGREQLEYARKEMAEGMAFLDHSQKLIKLADRSESGWAVVEECLS